MVRGLERVKFHGEFNYASPMALKWCVFKRSQKNQVFKPKTAIFGQNWNLGPTCWLAILIKPYWVLMLSPIIHSGVKNLKKMGFQEPKIWKKGQKKAIFGPKTHNGLIYWLAIVFKLYWVLMLGPIIHPAVLNWRKMGFLIPKNWKIFQRMAKISRNGYFWS